MWIWFVFWILVFFPVIVLVYLITYPFDRYQRFPNRLLKGLGLLMIGINPGWKVEFRGLERYERGSPAIFVANHQSFMDMPVIYLLPWKMKWVAKKSLFRIPVLGWMIYMTGHLAIDRHSMKSVRKLDQLVEPIQQGIPAMIFPEGTRTANGELKRFKTGAFLLAKRYNFKLYPLVLDGGYQVLPSGNWRFRFNERFIVSVQEGIDPEQFDTIDELRKHTYDVISRKLDAIRQEDDATKP